MICNVSWETTFFASQSDPRAFVGLCYAKKKNDFFQMCVWYYLIDNLPIYKCN